MARIANEISGMRRVLHRHGVYSLFSANEVTANRSFQTPCCKVQYRGDRFPRHVELFHDFLDA